MEYNDEIFPSPEIMAKMTSAFSASVSTQCAQVDICEMTEYRQKAELEEILRLLNFCEGFLKWIESSDANFDDIKQLLEQINKDKIEAMCCCGRHRLDYRFACDRDKNGCMLPRKEHCNNHKDGCHDKCDYKNDCGDFCCDPCGDFDWNKGFDRCKDKDFNRNCKDYCKCELEIIDRVIKLLTLRNSIIDKECMIRLIKSRMDTFKLIFNKYCK